MDFRHCQTLKTVLTHVVDDFTIDNFTSLCMSNEVIFLELVYKQWKTGPVPKSVQMSIRLPEP